MNKIASVLLFNFMAKYCYIFQKT